MHWEWLVDPMTLKRLLRDKRHARLLSAASRGDAAAFQRLYGELFGPVASFFYKRVERREDAEELISDVFHRLLKNLNRFDPKRGSVLSWLLTSAHNALVDYYRGRKQNASLDDIVEILACRRADPLEGLLQSERIRRVRDMLDELPADTRHMFALRFEHELRYKEIGECMDLSEAAVKQRFSRAMRDLRITWLEDARKPGEVDYAL